MTQNATVSGERNGAVMVGSEHKHRPVLRSTTWRVGAALLLAGFVVGGNTAVAGDIGDQAFGSEIPVYPLRKSQNGRYLVDQKNTPVLLVGDSPHTIFANLSLQQADAYFRNRASFGINIVWAELLCDPYVNGRPDASTYDGIPPFLKKDDFSTPNPAYFARVDAMIRLAARYNITVLLDTMETGGLIETVVANGTKKSYDYGAYLGKRYKDFPNIVWITGNDFQDWRTRPDQNAGIAAIMKGVADTDKNHLQTDQLDYNISASLDDPLLVPYLGLSGVYTYYPTYAETLLEYNRAKNLPIFMLEANYEFESNNGAAFDYGNPATLRRQEYWTMLSGAAGQMYGNYYTWTFAKGWEQHLSTPGARQLQGMKAFFSSYPWWKLVPDQQHKAVVAGYGKFSTARTTVRGDTYVTAARIPDGSLLIAYCPTRTTLSVDMNTMRGPTTARWFDPTNGRYVTVLGSTSSNNGIRTFSTPGANSENGRDWVLVLQSVGRQDDGIGAKAEADRG